MNSSAKTAVPVWFWAIAVVAVLWNLMGCMAFAMEMFMQEAAIEQYSDEQKEWVRSIPSWIYIVYAAAVGSGLVGSIGLCMRAKWTIPLYIVCLVSVLIQMIYTMVIQGGLQVMGASSAIMPGLVITLAAFLLWFAYFANGRGWFGGAEPSPSV